MPGCWGRDEVVFWAKVDKVLFIIAHIINIFLKENELCDIVFILFDTKFRHVLGGRKHNSHIKIVTFVLLFSV